MDFLSMVSIQRQLLRTGAATLTAIYVPLNAAVVENFNPGLNLGPIAAIGRDQMVLGCKGVARLQQSSSTIASQQCGPGMQPGPLRKFFKDPFTPLI